MKVKQHSNIAAIVEPLIAPAVAECGVSLWDVVFEKEGSAWFLRITIDMEGGLDMATCERFTQLVNPILDDADPIDQAYYLEIGSPGLGRRLRTPQHYTASIGQEVLVRTIRPIDGKRDFVGILEAYADKTLTLAETDGTQRIFPLGDVSFTKYNDDNF
ncbi:MAG: ribosome maturation factor RimP [Clostridia bacterium]|nr:ribosome maturation factor RimP [Clostridia bacterium]